MKTYETGLEVRAHGDREFSECKDPGRRCRDGLKQQKQSTSSVMASLRSCQSVRSVTTMNV